MVADNLTCTHGNENRILTMSNTRRYTCRRSFHRVATIVAASQRDGQGSQPGTRAQIVPIPNVIALAAPAGPATAKAGNFGSYNPVFAERQAGIGICQRGSVFPQRPPNTQQGFARIYQTTPPEAWRGLAIFGSR